MYQFPNIPQAYPCREMLRACDWQKGLHAALPKWQFDKSEEGNLIIQQLPNSTQNPSLPKLIVSSCTLQQIQARAEYLVQTAE